MRDHEQTVLAFLDCWRRFDLDGAVDRIATAAVFVPDIKADPVIGRDAIRTLWSDYMTKMQSYACDVRTIAARDAVVFVERVERIGSSRGNEMVLPIVGVFEFDGDGLIAAWRDYWDTSMAGAH